MVRLKKRLHIGNRVFYVGDQIDLDKYPEVEAELRKMREGASGPPGAGAPGNKEEKITRSPRDKMMRASGYKRK